MTGFPSESGDGRIESDEVTRGIINGANNVSGRAIHVPAMDDAQFVTPGGVRPLVADDRAARLSRMSDVYCPTMPELSIVTMLFAASSGQATVAQ